MAALEEGLLAFAQLAFGGACRTHGHIELFEPPLDDAEVVEDQLGLEGGDVAVRVDAAVGVRDVVAVEGAHDVDQRIGGAQRLAGRRRAALEERRQVVELDHVRRDLLRADERAELVQHRVRQLDSADVLAAGVGAGARVAACERAEDGALAGLGEADDRIHAARVRGSGVRGEGRRESG